MFRTRNRIPNHVICNERRVNLTSTHVHNTCSLDMVAPLTLFSSLLIFLFYTPQQSALALHLIRSRFYSLIIWSKETNTTTRWHTFFTLFSFIDKLDLCLRVIVGHCSLLSLSIEQQNAEPKDRSLKDKPKISTKKEPKRNNQSLNIPFLTVPLIPR